MKGLCITSMVLAFWHTAYNGLLYNFRFHFMREISAALGFFVYDLYNFLIL
jgi:hypothetical protein